MGQSKCIMECSNANLRTKGATKMYMLHIRIHYLDRNRFIIQNAVSTMQIEMAHCIIEFLRGRVNKKTAELISG